MFSKKMIMSIWILGVAFTISIFIGLSGSAAMAECENDNEFTREFLLDDCKFMPNGYKSIFYPQALL